MKSITLKTLIGLAIWMPVQAQPLSAVQHNTLLDGLLNLAVLLAAIVVLIFCYRIQQKSESRRRCE